MQVNFLFLQFLTKKGKIQIQSYAKYTLVILSKPFYADKKVSLPHWYYFTRLAEGQVFLWEFPLQALEVICHLRVIFQFCREADRALATVGYQ
jgi:hypothetical protein